MNHPLSDEAAPWLVGGALLWIAGWIVASVIYRRQRGKPIFPRLPEDALFAETGASGASQDNVLSRMGRARNALLVSVTTSELRVTPFFPFTLLFLPEVFGLDRRIPLSTVRRADAVVGMGGRLQVYIDFTDADGRSRRMRLELRDPQGFLGALAGRPASGRADIVQ